MSDQYKTIHNFTIQEMKNFCTSTDNIPIQVTNFVIKYMYILDLKSSR